jgi:hypothetical protein
MKYKILMFLSALGVLLPVLVFSQVFEKGRQESKSYRVYKETSLEIYNKYGNIQLFTWDKDSVRIDIDMQIKASKESKVDKIFEYVDFEFSDSRYYVIARTRLNQQGAFWSEVSDLANAFFSGSTKVQINYSVYLPQNMNIRLENKFGNIYSTDHSGKTTVILSNGDFKANDLSGDIAMDVSFGNASVNQIRTGKIIISYGELELESAESLVIESKSSTVNIGKAVTLDINSKRDKYFIDEVATVTGTSSFSYLTFKDFSSELNLKADYGEIKLESIKPEFKLIEMNSNYSDMVFKLPANASYGVNISHSGSTVITSPQNYSGMKTEVTDKKTDQYQTTGITGSSAVKKGKINIVIVSGKIMFRDIP